jgi:predicted ATP-dependent serine protease
MSILRWCNNCRTLSLKWSIKCPFCYANREFDIKINVNKIRNRKRGIYELSKDSEKE